MELYDFSLIPSGSQPSSTVGGLGTFAAAGLDVFGGNCRFVTPCPY